MKGNLLVAHGGGPTPVINASLQGVIQEARRYSEIDKVIGARFGIEGLLAEEFVDLGVQPEGFVQRLSFTPGSVLGSCRRKLTAEDYPVILDILRRHGIQYFLYNGGNDSMDTCSRIARLAGDEIRVIGIPKTIDNDLAVTDHCPGFGSAARYVAVSARELATEVASLPIHVVVMEVMGRNAGWLAASAMLAGSDGGRGPRMIHLPESPFSQEEFLTDVEALWSREKGFLIVASEGLKDTKGQSLADTGILDGFGHTIPGGVAQLLADTIIRELGIKCRAEKPGLLGRASLALQSPTDREEAYQVGARAVSAAVDGETGKMVSLRRVSTAPYRIDLELVALDRVANIEKKFPQEWINDRGNDIRENFKDYCEPLIGEPLPEFAGF
jgi:6-phosphofructokinase 1